MALPGPPLMAIGAKGRTHHLDVVLGLGRDQELGIDVATVEQVCAGEEVAHG